MRWPLIFLFSPLIAAGGGRLRHVNWIGGGKAVLETSFERPLEFAFAGVLPPALALVVALLLHDGVLRNGHGCFSLQGTHWASDAPGKRRTGPVLVQITHGA